MSILTLLKKTVEYILNFCSSLPMQQFTSQWLVAIGCLDTFISDISPCINSFVLLLTILLSKMIYYTMFTFSNSSYLNRTPRYVKILLASFLGYILASLILLWITIFIFWCYKLFPLLSNGVLQDMNWLYLIIEILSWPEPVDHEIYMLFMIIDLYITIVTSYRR